MTNEEMLKQDLERAVKELEIDGSNTKQKVKHLLEECLETYFKPKKYLTWDDIVRDQFYKVLLNGKKYEIVKRYDDYEYYEDYISGLSSTFIFECDKEFFNDLHLELVDEVLKND
jgi:hypothetical protein